MKVVCIIQARMGSSRLPGKIAKDIAGETMLHRVVSRVSRAARLDEVVVATTTEPQDDEVVTICAELGVPVCRGPELDVLERYHQCARAHGAEVVVRVTSDCPLIDPVVIDAVVNTLLGGELDYASTGLPRSFPRGLDSEAFTMESFERVAAEASEDYEHVHVTPRYYQNPDLFRLAGYSGNADHSHHRWTVDTPEDLALVRAIYEHFDGKDDFGWEEVLALVSRHPELSAINAEIEQKELKEL